jgi:hypothetical protein
MKLFLYLCNRELIDIFDETGGGVGFGLGKVCFPLGEKTTENKRDKY